MGESGRDDSDNRSLISEVLKETEFKLFFHFSSHFLIFQTVFFSYMGKKSLHVVYVKGKIKSYEIYPPKIMMDQSFSSQKMFPKIRCVEIVQDLL